MKIIIAPDKFKGSLTSMQACEIIAAGILQVDDKAAIIQFPMTDGGDGFAEVLQYYLHTQTVTCTTVDPLMHSIDATYQWNEVNKTAIIELAAASGFQLLTPKERDPLQASTYGTGLLMLHAIDNGAEKIILGLGGSATNDAGTGILAALGFTFLDADSSDLSPVGENLQHIKKIVAPQVMPNIQLELACDVKNVLYGADGAAMVYAAQKGADENAVQILDKGLRQFATVIKSQTGKDVATIPGAGAAGGVASGLIAYFKAAIVEGAKLVIEASRLEEQLNGVNLILTGEGKLDSQSRQGKVTQHIAALGKQYNIPVIALCGSTEFEERQTKEMGFLFIKSIVSDTVTEMSAVQNAKRLLKETATSAFTAFLQHAE